MLSICCIFCVPSSWNRTWILESNLAAQSCQLSVIWVFSNQVTPESSDVHKLWQRQNKIILPLPFWGHRFLRIKKKSARVSAVSFLFLPPLRSSLFHGRLAHILSWEALKWLLCTCCIPMLRAPLPVSVSSDPAAPGSPRGHCRVTPGIGGGRRRLIIWPAGNP